MRSRWCQTRRIAVRCALRALVMKSTRERQSRGSGLSFRVAANTAVDASTLICQVVIGIREDESDSPSAPHRDAPRPRLHYCEHSSSSGALQLLAVGLGEPQLASKTSACSV